MHSWTRAVEILATLAECQQQGGGESGLGVVAMADQVQLATSSTNTSFVSGSGPPTMAVSPYSSTTSSSGATALPPKSTANVPPATGTSEWCARGNGDAPETSFCSHVRPWGSNAHRSSQIAVAVEPPAGVAASSAPSVSSVGGSGFWPSPPQTTSIGNPSASVSDAAACHARACGRALTGGGEFFEPARERDPLEPFEPCVVGGWVVGGGVLGGAGVVGWMCWASVGACWASVGACWASAEGWATHVGGARRVHLIVDLG